MPSAARMTEIVCYSILNFIPCMMLAIYPFWNCRRYSRKITVVLIGIIMAMQIFIGVYATLLLQGSAAILSLASTGIYLFFYFWAFRGNIGKMLFTLLMLSHINNYLVILAKFLEGQWNLALALQRYRWSFSVCLLLVELLIYVPLFFYIKKVYTPAFRESGNSFVWRYLWMIPATFYLCWYYTTYYNNLTSLKQALQPDTSIFLFVMNAGAFVTVHVVIRLLQEEAKNRQLELGNHRLSMQELQYESLRKHIQETRRARHDMRHHFIVMSAYLESGDIEKLNSYVKEYVGQFPEEGQIVFCEHSVINMLIGYYYQIAKENRIEFRVKVNLPEKICVSDNDLSILFGNLLENAIEACKEQEQKGCMEILCDCKNDNCMVLIVENTYENEVRMDKNGIYLSTKHKGCGIGIESVKSIADKYQGVCKIEHDKDRFRVHVLLKCNGNVKDSE